MAAKEYVRKVNKVPNSVPVLEASDFCKAKFRDSNNDTCCMLGWFRTVFCHEDVAAEKAETENPKDTIFGDKKEGISTRKNYQDWRPQALQAIVKECKRVDKHSVNPQFSQFWSFDRNYYAADDIANFNDEEDRKLETLARVWNRAMSRLSYTEGNPEA